ncbi:MULTISPECIES: MipA/OmpV family protein [Pseudoalteromonas]|uniref:Structural protein MipA n=1 Tax=Pseudoalteromonas amylolytica TaxID=1859457 RepID=A0A1S1MVW5_9GAMM|nr:MULTISPECIES: MipA/OmpV family protein [Pseudoalteromonas]OHU85114.1 hypothetical protein BFC16_20795 [Pseudoalteromonas sp. JW3]OHU89935.1 hypothetical protein BET10_14180 [Pseudoalteromonas amylolytica]
MKQVLVAMSMVAAMGVQAQQCQPQGEDCIEVGQWQFAVAVGAGVMTNPLEGGDNIPLFILPYFSYYGDNFFVENTTVGYTFSHQRDFDLSFIVEPNVEQAFFERHHLRSIVAPEKYLDVNGMVVDNLPEAVPPTSDEDNPTKTPSYKPKISIDEITSRDWTIDGGLLLHWYINDTSKLSASWLYDLGGVYKGQHATLTYSQQLPLPIEANAKLQLKVGAQWQSQQLVDYYYGLRTTDSSDPRLYYQGRSSLSPFASIAYNHRINKHWQLKFNIKHTWLADGISDSPLVTSSGSSSIFIGGLYEF